MTSVVIKGSVDEEAGLGLSHSAEREVVLGLVYLEREARDARLIGLANTIRSSMQRYLTARVPNSAGN